ncbi:MAG: hypothetical protein GXO74_07885 [Calditrichaeota bacterium]|nr:hypothetical protein [Calditrichota bacterium]
MAKKFLSFLLLIVSLFFFASCQQQRHQKIDDDTFVQIYCDVVTNTDLVEANKKQALIDSILQQYHVNYADFQYKLELLKKNNEEWYKIYDKIVKELEKRIQELDEKKSQKSGTESQKK